MAAGIGIYFSLHAEPPLWTGIAALAVAIAAIIPFYKNKTAVLLWLPLMLAVLGFTAAQLRTAMVDTVVLQEKTYPLDLEGRVAELDNLPKGYRLVLDRLQYDTNDVFAQNPMPRRVRVNVRGDSIPPQAGDIVRLKAVLLPLSPPVLPDAFDFQRHAYFHGIGATGYTVGKVTVIQERQGGFFFSFLRRYIRTHIAAVITNKDEAAITIALLDGEDHDISKETYDNIRIAGIAHLIAISGLQITLVTGFFFLMVRWGLAAIPSFALRYPIKKITAFIAMLGAVFYMLLIGDSIPAERSVIMVCVVMLAIILDRDPFTLRLASFSALAILLFQPENLVGPSFQLSFAAVIALIAFYETTREWWSIGLKERHWLSKLAVYIGGSLATTLVATVATAPFTLFHFLKSPLFPGLVANLIAVPLSSFVTMPASIIGCLLSPFGLGLEIIPFKIAGWSVGVIIQTANIVSQWPYTVYHVDAWPVWILVLISLGGLWVCFWRGAIRWLGVPAILIGVFLIQGVPRADILIADHAKIFALRDDNNILWLSSATAQKFVSREWIEREAEAGHEFLPKEDDDDGKSPLTCDAESCIYQHKKFIVSFVKEYSALPQDCKVADIIISDKLELADWSCKGKNPPLLLDKWAFRDKGAHAIYLNDNGSIRIKTNYDQRGWRPWTG